MSLPSLWLVGWADPARLVCATRLVWTSVCAVAAVVSGAEEWERGLQRRAGHVDAIAERRPELLGINQNALESAQRDIQNVILRTASVGESGHIAGDETQPLNLRDRRGGDAGVQAQEVGNQAGLVFGAARADWGHVLD